MLSSIGKAMICAAATLWLATPALAQETVDVGVLKQSDIKVVQRLLFPKANRTELSGMVGYMPFDPFLVTPNLQLGYTKHTSENLAFGATLGGGYGLKNTYYNELESATYGIAPDAYRYLASLTGGVEYAPIYAKLNFDSKKVVHYDVYGAGRLGVSFEQSVIPEGGFAVAPTVSLAVGARFFLPNNKAIKFELRDDLLIEHRKLTDSTHLKQNVNLLIGLSMLSPLDKASR
jgi:outer membrane beta-barrel protein